MWKTRAKVKARRSKKAIESERNISVMDGRELGFVILFNFSIFLYFPFLMGCGLGFQRHVMECNRTPGGCWVLV